MLERINKRIDTLTTNDYGIKENNARVENTLKTISKDLSTLIQAVSYKMPCVSITSDNANSNKKRYFSLTYYYIKKGKVKQTMPNALKKEYVQSTNLEWTAYDEAEKALYVEFKNGTQYVYYGVPKETFNGFLNAGSKGKFFTLIIKR